jgi:hypothetical protein
VEFEFDDGTTDFAEVGDKETAEFYAREQLGETAPNVLHPRKNPRCELPGSHSRCRWQRRYRRKGMGKRVKINRMICVPFMDQRPVKAVSVPLHRRDPRNYKRVAG